MATNFMTVYSSDLLSLNSQVNIMLAQGYSTVGGLCITPPENLGMPGISVNNSGVCSQAKFFQAMQK